MTSILVTGGAGFIGSHLCERLLNSGHRVTCLDNLSTGSFQNIAHLSESAGFTFLDTDARRPVAWAERFDQIFHLASPASPVAYFRMPVETAMVNAEGTFNILETARDHGARALIASTSEVYGDPLIHPQKEDYWGNVNPVGPRSSYDEGKRFAEALAIAYHDTYELDVRIVRIFNTYGPRSDPHDGRMIPNFICQALIGEPMTIFGEGDQTRSLCYVDDLVEGLIAAMDCGEAAGEVINLGCPDERAVREFATLIKEILSSPSELQFCPAREEEPIRRRPDISKAQTLLGWEPATPLYAGLERTISWFRQRLSVPKRSGNGAHRRSGVMR